MPTRAEIISLLTGPGGACEIEQVAVNGATIRSWKNAPPNMAAIVEASRNHGDREFIIYQGERLTFTEHYRRVAALARSLVTHYGVRKGDRIAIAMRNYPEWSIAFWAAVSVGAVAVPLNAWWTSRELEYGLSDSGARLAFVDQKRLERVQQIGSSLPLEHLIGVRCDSYPPSVTPFHHAVGEPAADIALPLVELAPDDDATIFYTSGTTGFPKGTLGSHRNFCSVVGNLRFNGALALMRMGGRVEDLGILNLIPQAALLVVPLFHVSGCHGIMLPMFMAGGKLVMLPKWDPGAALDAIEQEKITLLSGVPTMIWQLFQEPDITRRDLSSLLQLGYGGAPAPPELLRMIKSKAPSATVTNGWGITETSSAISVIMGQDYVDRPDSVGLPSAACEVKVVDPSGHDLPANELGELWVRGPNVVKGYWNRPDATAEAFTDGWFHTGDVGKIDADGHIYILDRLKDMIIRGGENVYCAEVEAVLVEHPGISAACVFGLPHQALGEEVAAAVQVPPGVALGEQELQEFAAARLAHFKVPGKIWFRTDPFPVGATGKVQKKEIRAYYAGLLERDAR